jgi:tetratricopeptide (TPR) repeat protein
MGLLALPALAGCRGPRVAARQMTPSQSPATAEKITPDASTGPAAGAKGTGTATVAGAGGAPGETPPRPLRRCFPAMPSWVDAPVADLLDHAAEMFDGDDFEGALACAEEAARQAPRSVEAHHNRAVALLRLDRVEEARDALTLALALSPDDPETLEAAADLNINQLPPSADRSAIGLELARRGSRRASRRDPERLARLALLEGQALVDLGRAAEGLRRIDVALAAAPKLVAAEYERGVALFELCRFAEARRMFEKVLASTPDHGHALYHLGLIDEREGRDTSAAERLAKATALDPKAFPPPPEISPAEFSERLRRAVAALPPDVVKDLSAIEVQAAEIPSMDDLTAEKPPLSPTILGLFRGLPLDWKEDSAPPTQAGRTGQVGRAKAGSKGSAKDKAKDKRGKGRDGSGDDEAPAGDDAAGGGGEGIARCGFPDRAIVLYRRNLLRTVADAAELDRAITRTLLHEVGHLRGEDDGSLRDRGLE